MIRPAARLSALFAVCALLSAVRAEERPLRIAVMSDVQGYPYAEDAGMRNLEKALDWFAALKPDVVVNNGDINDSGRNVDAVAYYRRRCDERLGELPHVNCLGNHELVIPAEMRPLRDEAKCRAEFNALFGAGPGKLVHRIIGGCDFIAYAFGSSAGYTDAEMDELDAALKQATARDATRPIFVVTHYHPKDTVNSSRSDDAGGRLFKTLAAYPQVVNLSGHSHNPLQDPRSIWQGAFTVIDTSTLCYGCLTAPKPCANMISSLMPYGHEAVGCLMLEVYPDRIVVRRYSVGQGVELEPESPWTLRLPYDPKAPQFDFAGRAAHEAAPEFPSDPKPALWYDYGYAYLMFDAVTDRSSVFVYRVDLAQDGGETKTYYHLADFYRAPSLRVPRIAFRAPPHSLQSGGSYQVTITPLGFFGTAGKPISWHLRIQPQYRFGNLPPSFVQE